MNITNPHFVDLKKQTIRFTIENSNGIKSLAELKIPKDGAKGLNKHWDYIVDNFDIKRMEKEFDDFLSSRNKRLENRDKKQKAAMQNAKLKMLFDQKVEVFKYPFIKEADESTKSAIRRSPDSMILLSIVAAEFQKYLKKKKMNYIDFLNHMDELEYDDTE